MRLRILATAFLLLSLYGSASAQPWQGYFDPTETRQAGMRLLVFDPTLGPDGDYVLLLLTVAAPVATQDWERVFQKTATPPADAQVLVLDPDQPRSDRARYKRLSITDILPPAARLLYVATATQAFTPGEMNPDMRLAIDGAETDDIPFGAVVLFTGPLFQPEIGDVEVLFGTEPATALRNRVGATVSWADLMENDIHLVIRLATTWNLLY